MIIRVSGGSSGIGDYLETGAKVGRENTRDELDERVILEGSISELESVIDTMGDCNSQKYLHITLSFKEQEISDDLFNQISEDFKNFAFEATADDEFYYYAEAHNPKIKKVIDKHGEEHERLPHIHAVIPQYNLITGEKEDFLGNIDNITKYIDAFQEEINERYQLESPKDNRREIPGQKADILNRHKLDPDMTRKQVKEGVLDIIKSDDTIRSVEQLAQKLGDFGAVTVRENAKDGEYINIKLSDDKKAINLKDDQFKNAFLSSRDATHIKGKDNKKTLEEWKNKARETRFIRPLGVKKRESFRSLSADEKTAFLNEKMANVADVGEEFKQADKTTQDKETEQTAVIQTEPSQPTEQTAVIQAEPSQPTEQTAVKYKHRLKQIETDRGQKEWGNKINDINARVAIDYLAYHYGTDERLQVTKNKQGHDRIKDGTRNYTVSDYMAKKINLNWEEIKTSLDAISEQQAKGGHAKSQVNSKIAWKKFQEFESKLEGLSGVNARFIQSRKEIIENTKFPNDNEKMTKAQGFAYRKLLNEQREEQLKTLTDETKSNREYYYQKPNERYLKFLHNEAEQGDLLCLNELNRVHPIRDDSNYHLSFIQKEKSRFKPIDSDFKVSITERGNIEYKDTDNRVIIEDKGDKISVKIKSADNIVKALEMAQKRFGVDNFEITNATAHDMKAIEQASDKAQIKVSVKRPEKMTIEQDKPKTAKQKDDRGR